MNSDIPLDYAVFQLSPRRSRCELFISYDGTTEKLASGQVKPFATHLKSAEEQFASSAKSIKLEVKRCNNSESWFTKGTLERFVQYVSTPEVLEQTNTFDAEMSQLEAARKIYSQGPGDGSGRDGGAPIASDATKKELLRAIDLRLVAVGQDLSTACIHASSTGLNPDTVIELQLFADQFGAHRLSESCSKFMSLCQRRPELFIFNKRKDRVNEHAVRSSSSSDMSLDDQAHDSSQLEKPNELKSSPLQFEKGKTSSIENKDDTGGSNDRNKEKKEHFSLEIPDSEASSTIAKPLTRRLSVQDRISLFENKQKENTSGSGSKPVVGKSVELHRLSSDVSSASQMVPEKAVLRRWSGASDMSIDSSGEKKDVDSSSAGTPISGTVFKPDTTQGLDASHVGHIRLENPSNSKKEELEQKASYSKSRSFSGRYESDELKDQSNTVKQSNASFGKTVEDTGFQNQIKSPAWPREVEKFSSRAQTSCEEKNLSDESEDFQLRDRHVPGTHSRTFQREITDQPSDSESSVVSSVSAVSQRKGNEVDQVIAPAKLRYLGQRKQVAKKEYESAEQQPENSSIELEDSGAHRMKFQRQGSNSVQAKTSKGRRDSGSGLVMPGFAGKTISDNEETFSSISKTSKGNHEINDDLKLKADELEKLFAEHKLRLPVNQSSVTRKSKSVEAEEQTPDISTPQSVSTKMVDKPSLMQPLENQDFDKTPKQNIYGLGSSDDSRGKLYDKYMQKRYSKLKEEWSSNRAEKEARMKTMQAIFERSKSEMKTKLAGSAERQDSHHRAEKLRSFSARSAIRREQPIHSFVSDEDEEKAEFGRGSLAIDAHVASGSSRSVQNKKTFSTNNTLSTTPRTSGVSAPRSSAKASASNTSRRKLQQENPLAQSVPLFSDFRKENSKPSIASSKGTGRSQVRNYTRSKSTSEDVSFEEKSRRPNHLRKSSASPLELKDLTSLNFDDVEHEDGTFLKKGHASSILRSRASFTAKTLVIEDEELINSKVEEDLESVVDEDVKSANSGFENGDAMRVPSESNPASMAEMPALLPTAFRSMVSVLDSPGESPGSWHSRVHNPYSFQHEISDFDASVDSPIGSPAYWNSNDSDATRMRKKWGAAQKPTIDSAHGQPRKDVTKGLKRFLKFGRKSRGPDSLVDWVSATTSEGDDDMEDGKDLAKWSSEDLKKSRMGFSHYNPDDGFSETDSVGEKARGYPTSIPTPPTNYQLKEDHLSGSALKAPKSFFSLSTFRSKGSDSKPR